MSNDRNNPVRPRDAASLVMVRRIDGKPHILMGRRHVRHRFLPNVYVFPGGRIDRRDYRAPVAENLRPEVLDRLSRGGSGRMARALAITAVRETYEETGLLLGEKRDRHILPDLSRLDYIARAITPPESPIRFHNRFFLADGAHAIGELGGSGELLDLHWVALKDALRLPVIDVTEFVLGELTRLLSLPDPGQQPIPLFSYRSGAARIRYLT